MNAGWYSIGYEGASEAAKKQAERKSKEIPRFWGKVENPKEFVFVDDVCFGIEEHTIRMENNRFQQFTCFKENNCPFCHAFPKSPANYSGCFTVVDLTGWKTRQGQVRDKNRLSLLALPPKGIQVLVSIRSARQGRPLVGCQFLMAGSNFKFIREFDPTKVLEKYQPIDYASLLAPLTLEAAQKIVTQIIGTQNSSSQTETTFDSYQPSYNEFQNPDEILF